MRSLESGALPHGSIHMSGAGEINPSTSSSAPILCCISYIQLNHTEMTDSSSKECVDILTVSAIL